MNERVCAEDMKVSSGKLVDFGNIPCSVIGFTEHYSSRKLVHYRLVSMESSNMYLFITYTGKYIPFGLSWLSHYTCNALFLPNSYGELEQALFRRTRISGTEDGS